MCLAIPGRVIEIGDDALRTAKVAFDGVVKAASLALVPEARLGDYVIVHAGLALQIVDEESADTIFATLRELAAARELDEVP